MKAYKFQSFRETLRKLEVRDHALESARCKCLSKYISELGAKSYVVEEGYTDPGYLLDYSNYYARSHKDLPKATKRIHFFSLDPAALRSQWQASLLHRDRSDEIDKAVNAHYLGFVVLKPLPLTVIGRTCLLTYPLRDDEKSRTRHFPVLRQYGITLFGLRLSIQSIAFQEQDAEVAACATTAIWFALHGLPKRFTTQEIPSPFDITNHGSDNMPAPIAGKVGRKFPAGGLSVLQIDAYFRRCGLESMIVSLHPTEDPGAFVDSIAAYVRGGVPIVLLGSLHASDYERSGYEDLGHHALTILGFAVDDGFKPGAWTQRIARIFAHDDNVGPFSSFRIERLSVDLHSSIISNAYYDQEPAARAAIAGASAASTRKASATEETTHLLNISGLRRQGGEIYRRVLPHHLVIPASAKIRFPYEIVRDFAETLYEMASSDPVFAKRQRPVSWSIELQDISDFKHKIRRADWVASEMREQVLRAPLSHYLWVLTFAVEGTERQDEVITQFIFDATALRQSGGLDVMLQTKKSNLGIAFIAAVLGAAEEVVSSRNSYRIVAKQEIRPCLKKMVDIWMAD